MIYGNGFLMMPPRYDTNNPWGRAHKLADRLAVWWNKHSTIGQPVAAGFAGFYAVGGRNVR